MRDDSGSTHTYSRRAIMLGVLQGAALVVLGTRLAWLQIAQGQKYKTLSDKNRINIKMLAPSRGQILDRFGVPLAVNEQNFRALVVAEQAGDVEAALRRLQNVITLSEDEVKATLERSKKVAKFVPVEIRDDLKWEEVAAVEVNLPDLPGISIDVGEVRHYPLGKATAHMIGYVGAVSKKDLTGDPLLTLPGFKIGKTGIEETYDEDMRGRAGAAEMEVNVVGHEVRELGRRPGTEGRNVVLTIDAALQLAAQERVSQERSASAVLMDAHTGAIYALVSHPAFDPNIFSRGIPATLWEELLADPALPLTNKAIAGQYPPGSTFKMVTALAGLRTGKMNEHRRVYCPGHYEFGDNRFHCWKKEGHGWMTLADALAQSCDTYFYEISTEIGIDNIAIAARDMGLGSRFDFGLTAERPGLVPDKGWKQSHLGTSWTPGETIVASIGQGYLLATPLQLAVMTARFVNGGHEVRPWITGYVGGRAMVREDWPKMNLSREYMDLIKLGMDMVVNHERGTALGSRIKQPGWEMGGKTGTAQVRRITSQQRAQGVRNEDLPWHHRHHALFVGYAPIANPRYICSVVVEHGVGGSRAAAPMARDLLIEAQKRDPAIRPIQIAQSLKT